MEGKGFDYYVDEETLRDYRKKSLKQRLRWLYFGNKFRRKYPREIIERQERLRNSGIDGEPQ